MKDAFIIDGVRTAIGNFGGTLAAVRTDDLAAFVLKKIMDKKDLVAASTTAAYQQEFTKLFMQLQENPDFHEWMEIYKKLVYWELEMEKSDSPEMQDILQAQKKEANAAFFKYISKNYASWVAPGAPDAPIMSHQLLQFKVLPHVEKGTSTFFILI